VQFEVGLGQTTAPHSYSWLGWVQADLGAAQDHEPVGSFSLRQVEAKGNRRNSESRTGRVEGLLLCQEHGRSSRLVRLLRGQDVGGIGGPSGREPHSRDQLFATEAAPRGSFCRRRSPLGSLASAVDQV